MEYQQLPLISLPGLAALRLDALEESSAKVGELPSIVPSLLYQNGQHVTI